MYTVSKSFRTDRLERELQMVQLSATRCSYIAILWVILVSFAAITLCPASQRVFIVVVFYFVTTQSGNFWIHPRTAIKGKKVRLSPCFNYVPRHKGVLGWIYSSTHSLTSALDGDEWWASGPGRFTPREKAPSIHWIGRWMVPRAVLDPVVKRKIPSFLRESKPRTPIVQPLAPAVSIDNCYNAYLKFLWEALLCVRSI
jgi:hypothetical protein